MQNMIKREKIIKFIYEVEMSLINIIIRLSYSSLLIIDVLY